MQNRSIFPLNTLLPHLLVAFFTSSLTQTGIAQSDMVLEEVVVFGRNTNLIGEASSASEGYVSGADLLIRPLVKTAELLESMQGMVAVQHSGSGKANQYFLRGFNLDHGTDYTVQLDGVPLNMRSHGHGQGYLDVNGVIPEIVEGIDYRKGPYYADLGDFSLAGASYIRTISTIERRFVSAEVGDDGWQRYVGGMSQSLGDGVLTLVGEFKTFAGPWEKNEELDHMSIWAKYSAPTSFGQADFSVSSFSAGWDPTEQIPERAIGTAVCEDAFCALDPSATGSTDRWIGSMKLAGTDWNANVYLQHYDWRMSSNPTYDFQINQFDERWTLGGQADKTLLKHDSFDLVLGGEFRYDDVSRVGVEQFQDGEFVADIGDNEISQSSLGAFLQANWKLNEDLRLSLGARVDHFDFSAKANNANSAAGDANANQTSPKLGLAYRMMNNLELYANWGEGFHSNDARGVVSAVDPMPGISGGIGYEAGGRLTLGQFKFTGAYWRLDQDSELIFVGDSNSVEPKGASERDGLELTMFWQPVDWLGVDAAYTSSDARYVENPEGPYVEQAVEETFQLGFAVTRPDWDASLRLRYLGPYALDASNLRRGDSLTTLNFRSAYHWLSATLFVELINLADTDGKEITYNYPAYVEGLDPAGLSAEDIDCNVTDCMMSRATLPRSIRLGVSYRL